jgi:hypothetical protein
MRACPTSVVSFKYTLQGHRESTVSTPRVRTHSLRRAHSTLHTHNMERLSLVPMPMIRWAHGALGLDPTRDRAGLDAHAGVVAGLGSGGGGELDLGVRGAREVDQAAGGLLTVTEPSKRRRRPSESVGVGSILVWGE